MGIRAKDVVILGVLIAAAPAVSLLFRGNVAADSPLPTPTQQSSETAVSATADGISGMENAPGEDIFYTLYDEAAGTTFTVSEREYVIAAVMSELPCTYEYEAIKAQVVATRTYARHVAALRAKQPLPALQGAVFSVNTDTHWGYMTEQRGKVFFGADYERYRSLVSQAESETSGLLVTYDGAPIAACYHAISPGTTESAEVVFGSALPYLVPVDSAADTAADRYETEVSYTSDELSMLLRQYDPAFETDGSPSEWLGAAAATASGTVTQFMLCGQNYTGADIREALSLPSAAFTVSYAGGEFVFTVHGYGHGVGMSQHGANAMAQDGASFVDILAHYYPGTVCTAAA